MTLTTSWTIIVAVKTGNREISSPRFSSEEDAKADLKKINDAAKEGKWLELDWLSISGIEIVSAHTKKTTSGSVTMA
jgi:hypothetical protein